MTDHNDMGPLSPYYYPHTPPSVVSCAKDKKKAMELRVQAKRSALDMHDARDRAKNAHRRGDRYAEREYNQEARTHRIAKINLDKRAANIFFRANNKVTQQQVASHVETGGPHLIFRRVRLIKEERSTFTICMSRRLWSTPRRSFSLLNIGRVTRSPSLSVCVLVLSSN